MSEVFEAEALEQQELPNGWTLALVSDVAEIIRGVSYSKSDAKSSQQDGYLPILRANNIDGGHLNFDELVYVPEKYVTKKQLIRLGDVIIAMSSGSKHLVGKAAQASANYEAAFGTFCALLRPNSLLEAKLVGCFFQSPLYRETVSKLSSGVNINNLRADDVVNHQFLLPPLEEQRRIVEKLEALLSDLEASAANLEKALAKLKRYRQSVLKAAVEGELSREWREAHKGQLESASELLKRILEERRKRWEEAELAKMQAKGKVPLDDKWKAKYEEPEGVDSSELPEVPEGWVWASWSQVGQSQNGRGFPSSEYQDTGVKLLRPGNLHISGRVVWTDKNTQRLPKTWADEFPDYIIRSYELVMNLTAQSLKDEFLGRVCLTDSEEISLLNQRIARLTPMLIDVRFMLFLFKSPVFRQFVDGLNTGSLIQHMFTSQLGGFVFSLPPLEEQAYIVSEVDRLLSEADKAEETIRASLKRCERLRQAVLKQAFSGKLVPQNPTDEPASALLERLRASRAEADTKPGGRGRAKKAKNPQQEALL